MIDKVYIPTYQCPIPIISNANCVETLTTAECGPSADEESRKVAVGSKICKPVLCVEFAVILPKKPFVSSY